LNYLLIFYFILSSFTNPKKKGAIDIKARETNLMMFSKTLLTQPVVLVCTDRASRGLDFDSAPVTTYSFFDH
jgi:hypothetical protein